jgi:Zn-dependent membrane protease YugP
VLAGLNAERFPLLLHPVDAEITGVNQERNVLRIDGSVGTGVGAGLAADTTHVVPYEQVVLLPLLFEGFHGTSVNAMSLFALAAHKSVGGQLDHRNDPIVFRVIEVAAPDVAIFALSGCTNIQIDE